MSHLKHGILIILILCLLAVNAFAGVIELPIDPSGGLPTGKAYKVGMTDYEDPSISFHYDRVESKEYDCTYYVVRVKIANGTQIRTESARGWESKGRVNGSAISKRVNAVVSCNGDYFSGRSGSYLLRQGVELRPGMDPNQDLLLIDENGDFHILLADDKPEEMDKTVIDGKKIYNALCFGPAMIIDGQKVLNLDHEQRNTKGKHLAQRLCICQTGPLEYMLIACANYGLTLDALTNLAMELGAVQAYNLDGGNSASLYLFGHKINNTAGGEARQLSDILYFASAWEPDEE